MSTKIKIPKGWRELRPREKATAQDKVWVGWWEPCDGFIGRSQNECLTKLIRRIPKKRKKS